MSDIIDKLQQDAQPGNTPAAPPVQPQDTTPAHPDVAELVQKFERECLAAGISVAACIVVPHNSNKPLAFTIGHPYNVATIAVQLMQMTKTSLLESLKA
jgi:hypothetical protein